jgi:NAD(P)-dependent dehydrogenase (short-subunit alcohol dehydrogenase family)
MKQGIIIGASSGIGWELAVQLAAKRLSVRPCRQTT